MELLVHHNPEGVGAGINPFDHGSAIHTDIMEDRRPEAGARPVRLRRGLRRGAPRRGEVARQGARVLLPHRAAPLGSRRASARSCGSLYNARKHKGEIDPRLPALELDRAGHLAVHPPGGHPDRAALLRRRRPMVERDGTLLMVDDERLPLRPGEVPDAKRVRFRTLGCYPLTGAVESERRHACRRSSRKCC